MGKITGFKEFPRETTPYDAPLERIRHHREFLLEVPEEQLRRHGARCLDCGVPFCQSDHGWPFDNRVPGWDDLVYRGRGREALDRLHRTNNFPEWTGRVCPAPCEGACTLGINEPPVAIKKEIDAVKADKKMPKAEKDETLKELNEAHVPFGQSSSEQAVRRVGAGALHVRTVHVEHMLWLIGHIQQVRHARLHPKRHLVLGDASPRFWMAQFLRLEFIQIAQRVKALATHRPIHARRIGRVQNRIPLRAALNPLVNRCLLYTSPSPRDRTRSRMPSSA